MSDLGEDYGTLNKACVIYKHTNLLNGKAYVGKSVHTMEYRWNQHAAGNGGAPLFYAAIVKYGKDNFRHEVLWEGEENELNYWETYYIGEHKTLAPSGYNLTAGGDGGRLCQETKDRMRQTHMERIIKEKGYPGTIDNKKNKFYVRGFYYGNSKYIGAYDTLDDAKSACWLWYADPEEFKTPSSVSDRGAIFPDCNGFRATYKGIYIGLYKTEVDAWDAIKRYKEDPDGFRMPRGGKPKSKSKQFNLKIKGMYIGSYDTREKRDEAKIICKADPYNFKLPNGKLLSKDKAELIN